MLTTHRRIRAVCEGLQATARDRLLDKFGISTIGETLVERSRNGIVHSVGVSRRVRSAAEVGPSVTVIEGGELILIEIEQAIESMSGCRCAR